MRAIVAAIDDGRLDAQARLVVSNRPEAPAMAFARAHAIPTAHIATRRDPIAADARLAQALKDAGVEWVILSGYLRKLGPRTLSAFDRRILNVHPALLPRHGGQGMYGRRVHEAVIAEGETVTGASIHLADGEYDHGEVIAAVEIAVHPDDTPEVLEARVMGAEPALFVSTLQAIASGSLVI